MEKIGVIGLGRMGSAIAKRMSGQGHSVLGWSRTARDLPGITTAPDIATVIRGSDAIILSLLNDDAVAAVLDTVLENDLDGKLVIETSTVVPTILQDRIAGIHAKGGQAVDAPISGGPDLVTSGNCGVFIGGTDSAAARAKTALTSLTTRIFHVGPLGTGLVMKTINNGMLQAYFAGLEDMMPLACKAGLPLETALRILSGGPAGLPMVKDRISKVLGQDDTVGFEISATLKDADVFLRIADAYGLGAPSIARFAEITRAATNAGLGSQDPAALIARAYHSGEADT